MDNFFGNIIGGTLTDGLTIPATMAIWRAVNRRKEFCVIEARRQDNAETLIVECENDGVPTRNPVGIEYREHLALKFHQDDDRLPEVYALRENFPVAMHQNHTTDCAFRSLCLYFELWESLRRTWTAEKHLDRILWWLTETANGTLHRPDQPLEQLYFQSQHELVLPYDFTDRVDASGYHLAVESRNRGDQKKITLMGRMISSANHNPLTLDFPCIVLQVATIVHGPIEKIPPNLGELEDQLQRRGTSFSKPLFECIKTRCDADEKFRNSPSKITLLIIRLPLTRKVGEDAEKIEEWGFLIESSIGDLGVAAGALHKTDDRMYWLLTIIGSENQEKQNWSDFVIVPLEIVSGFTPSLARKACGLMDSGPKGVLAGVGSLGSEILDLWTRSGWGQWTIIDPDYVCPHNLARHHAVECHIGSNKVDVVKGLADLLIPGQPSSVISIVDKATNLNNERVKNSLREADFVIDVTTTLHFPRDLARNDTVHRALSVFITPSGQDAVLILEDNQRAIRLDCLEAQYYRQVISKPWGENHLAGNQSHLWTGAGCRDISVIIPNELIGIHGANLAAMIRLHSSQPNAAILVWHYDSLAGSLTLDRCGVAKPLSVSMDGLQIVWDAHVRQKIRSQRSEHLPNETGGVLLGYFDQVSQKVFIVDALPAPDDSHEEATGFVRGVAGLEEAVKSANDLTANIVGYVGEWHSHPQHCSSDPSRDDIKLLRHLAISLMDEGETALMLIVGEKDERWLVGKI